MSVNMDVSKSHHSQSMHQPAAFIEGNMRIKRERPSSPPRDVISKIEPSMDQLNEFQKRLKLQAPSPALSSASFKPEQSMDKIIYFQNRVNEGSPSRTSVNPDEFVLPSITFKYRDSYVSQMMSENLWCPECKDVPKEPVSIPCGHSFCKSCIQSYWTKPAQIGRYSCPLCRRRFTTRPALSLKVTLANVVQTHQHAAQSYTGPEEVACDICTGCKLKAVKTCLTCSVSYCETHVLHHYTVEALQKHRLMEPTKDLEQVGVHTLCETKQLRWVLQLGAESVGVASVAQVSAQQHYVAIK